MGVEIADIKRLKDLTGVGLTDAKKALEEAKGELQEAFEEMKTGAVARSVIVFDA